jgi:spermidine/putrescine-binding protein
VFLEQGAAEGRMTMLDDGREVLGAMLRMRGHSLNSTEPAALDTAKADALVAKPHLAAYVSAPVKGQLVAGDIWMAQLWNGDTRQAQLENPRIAFALPEEGSLIWTDYVVIPRTAPHPHSAYAFLEYILRPEVGAGISEATGYGSPNRAAISRMRDPIPYPSADQLERLEYQSDLGPAGALWDRVWTEVKAG